MDNQEKLGNDEDQEVSRDETQDPQLELRGGMTLNIKQGLAEDEAEGVKVLDEEDEKSGSKAEGKVLEEDDVGQEAGAGEEDS